MELLLSTTPRGNKICALNLNCYLKAKEDWPLEDILIWDHVLGHFEPKAEISWVTLGLALDSSRESADFYQLKGLDELLPHQEAFSAAAVFLFCFFYHTRKHVTDWN